MEWLYDMNVGMVYGIAYILRIKAENEEMKGTQKKYWRKHLYVI